MIRTIIVDDEFLVRIGLKNMAAWEKNGFEIVGEAADGQKALELCRMQNIDLVVTDIEMPKMNGIDLIRTLHLEMPHISIIVLSNHRNSDYIRETLRYGRALDYIFKLALDEEELDKTLQHTRTVIESLSSPCGPMEKEISSEPLFQKKQESWKLLLSSNKFSDEYSSLFETQFSTSFYCICIGIKYKNEKKQQTFTDKFPLIESIVNDTLAKENEKYDLLLSEGYFILFLEGQNKNTEQIFEICQKMENMHSLFKGSTMSFGISNLHSGITEITASFKEALHALAYSFFKSKADIRLYDPAASSILQNFIFSHHQLACFLQERNIEKIKYIFHEYLTQCAIAYNSDISLIKENCFDFLMLLSALLKESFGGMPPNSGNDRISSLIHNSLTLKELEQISLTFMDSLFTHYNISNSQIISKEVQKALEYIHKNYNKNFHLKDIAAYIGMNESYLSHLFKKELGKTLTAYLNEYRIQIAKQLILTSSSTLNLIAEQVGYTNYPYFSKVFRSIVGIEANKYKAIHEKKMVTLSDTN